jgi:hypothetical protein
MSEQLKEFIAGAIGMLLILSGGLVLILSFLFVRDGMSTPVPYLLFGTSIFFLATLALMWRYQRVRKWLVIHVLSWFFPG